MVDPTTGPFPAGGSLFGPWGGHQAGPARSCSSGSTGEDGAERYSTGPSTGAFPSGCSSSWGLSAWHASSGAMQGGCVVSWAVALGTWGPSCRQAYCRHVA